MEYRIKFEAVLPVKENGFSYYSEILPYISQNIDDKESFLEAAKFAYDNCKNGYRIAYIKAITH